MACFGLTLPLQSCKRKAVPRSAEETSEISEAGKHHVQEVTAAWYDVPVTSLAARRAGLSELTAAHDKLPLGTLLRVTSLTNGKSVKVRITDRGIHDRHVKLDLCREAAKELDMLSKGVARVQIEVIPDENSQAPTATPG